MNEYSDDLDTVIVKLVDEDTGEVFEDVELTTFQYEVFERLAEIEGVTTDEAILSALKNYLEKNVE